MRKVLYILGQLDDQDIDWLASAGVKRRLAPGEALIVMGRETPDLFIVLDGQVDVLIDGIGIVARLGAGEILGEMSFVDKAPPSATVSAHDPTIVLAINKSRIEERLKINTGFAARFYKALSIFLADRLRETQSRKKSNVADKAIAQDELDESVLDGVSMAGVRFQEMLQRLLR